MKSLFTICSMLLSIVGFSQALSYNQYEFLRVSNAKGSSRINFDNQYNDVKGDAFLLNNWADGKAVLANGKEYNHLQFKVDVYKNKMFTNIHDTVYDITDAITKRLILYPGNNDTTNAIVLSKEFTVPKMKSAFLQVLSEGKITFLKSYYKEIQDVQQGLYTAKERQFTDAVNYYIIKDNTPVEIKLSKKNIEKIFSSDEWSKLSTYVKENNLSLNEEKDCARLISYYNNLH